MAGFYRLKAWHTFGLNGSLPPFVSFRVFHGYHLNPLFSPFPPVQVRFGCCAKLRLIKRNNKTMRTLLNHFYTRCCDANGRDMSSVEFYWQVWQLALQCWRASKLP